MWRNTSEHGKTDRFKQTVLPHLPAAYNLARWLTRNEQDAEDAVQDAYVRAFRFFDGFHGTDGRAWLLQIVRNTCYTLLSQRRTREWTVSLDDTLELPAVADNPETIVLQRMSIERLGAILEDLPLEYKEVIVLRDLEEMRYKEIAEIVGIPLGTVMSRISRARRRIQQRLMEEDAASTASSSFGKAARHEL